MKSQQKQESQQKTENANTNCKNTILKSTTLRKQLMTIFIIFLYFLGGLLFCIQSGTYWLTLVDTYAGGNEEIDST